MNLKVCDDVADLKCLFKRRSFRWFSYTFGGPSIRSKFPLPAKSKFVQCALTCHHFISPISYAPSSKKTSHFGGGEGWENSKALYFQWVLMRTSSPTEPKECFRPSCLFCSKWNLTLSEEELLHRLANHKYGGRFLLWKHLILVCCHKSLCMMGFDDEYYKKT